MLSTTFALILFAAAPTPTPGFSLDAEGARAPTATNDDWSGWTDPGTTPAPAKKDAAAAKASKGKKAAKPSLLGRQPVIVGGIESAFATIEFVQGEIDEMWTITLDGGKVGKLTGRTARLRVGMVTPGKHDLAIFNERGILWSGRVEVRGNQTLLLEAKAAGLEASDPMALQSHAELREERVANGR